VRSLLGPWWLLCHDAAAADVAATDGAARADLQRALAWLHRRTGLPGGVRAAASVLTADPGLATAGDFALVVADPWAAGMPSAQEACGRAMQALRDVERASPGARLALVTGAPTPGGGALEHRQRAYVACLESRGTPLVLREAFDQSWRSARERDAGLLRADGTPKRWALQERPPRITVERDGDALRGRVDGPGRWAVVVWGRSAAGWTAGPRIAPERGSRWRGAPVAVAAAVAPADPGAGPRPGPVVVLLVAPGWVPPAGPLERPPPVDGAAVFAAAELP